VGRDGGKIIIFGCGGHSRSVGDIILLNDPDAALLFVDDNAREGEKIYGFDLVKKAPDDGSPYFLAIGDNQKRKSRFEEVGDFGLVSIISRTAHLGWQSVVGKGCFVGNFCHIGPETVIGEDTIINNAAIVEHEVKIGRHSHVGPNSTISGRCRIGDLVFVGVGATIKDYINVCSDVTIGAGATVVRDIVEPGVYVGTPARKIK
jgi:sugar O-acyltransferase (sialic acid O-acetyltransferase NeuD family)